MEFRASSHNGSFLNRAVDKHLEALNDGSLEDSHRIPLPTAKPASNRWAENDKKGNVYLRTNFGKTRGYVPPVTTYHTPRPIEERQESPQRRTETPGRIRRDHDSPFEKKYHREDILPPSSAFPQNQTFSTPGRNSVHQIRSSLERLSERSRPVEERQELPQRRTETLGRIRRDHDASFGNKYHREETLNSSPAFPQSQNFSAPGRNSVHQIRSSLERHRQQEYPISSLPGEYSTTMGGQSKSQKWIDSSMTPVENRNDSDGAHEQQHQNGRVANDQNNRSLEKGHQQQKANRQRILNALERMQTDTKSIPDEKHKKNQRSQSSASMERQIHVDKNYPFDQPAPNQSQSAPLHITSSESKSTVACSENEDTSTSSSMALAQTEVPNGEVAVSADDDSLFDFENEGKRRKDSKKATKKLLNSAKNQSVVVLESESEISFDFLEQTQAALKRTSQAGSKKRSVTNGLNVSFGDKDTIHHFQPDGAPTMEDKNSDRRKDKALVSFGSNAKDEVEDVMKDILLIGKRDEKGKKHALHMQGGGEKTRGAKEGASSDRRKNALDRLEASGLDDFTQKSEDDDPFLEVWNYMEDGITAVGVALGLEDPDPNSSDRQKKTESEQGLQDIIWGLASGVLFDPEDLEGPETPSQRVEDDCPSPGASSRNKEEHKTSFGGPEEFAPMKEEPKEEPKLDQEVVLAGLAIQAARSTHKVNGCVFDDRNIIDFSTDIKFVVVTLKLPLGLIFQDNDGGCWITKVIAGGHAHTNGSIKVGDQLAAIDGMSAINMEVDDVAMAVGKKTEEVELTFLRYVGPLRPIPKLSQEGSSSAISDLKKSRRKSATTQKRLVVTKRMPKKGCKGKRWFRMLNKTKCRVV